MDRPPAGDVDAVLCRFGYMLMTDPGAALAETRRVLRPGRAARAGGLGRARGQPVVRAVRRWSCASAASPATAPGAARAVRAGRRRARCRRRSRRPGFAVERVEAVELSRRHASFEELWEVHARPLAHASTTPCSRGPRRRSSRSRRRCSGRFAPFTAADGTLEIPGRALLVAGRRLIAAASRTAWRDSASAGSRLRLG